MKITFEDKSYVEIQSAKESGKLMLTVAAKDPANRNKNIINSVELTIEQLTELISSLS